MTVGQEVFAIHKNQLSDSHATSQEFCLPVKYVPWLVETYMNQQIHGCLTGSDCARETKHLPVNVLSVKQSFTSSITQ